MASGVGENEGGVGFVEVQLDSPTIGELMMRYQVRVLFLSFFSLTSFRLLIFGFLFPLLLGVGRSRSELEGVGRWGRVSVLLFLGFYVRSLLPPFSRAGR